MRVLVIGATGKIGRPLCARLRELEVMVTPGSRHPDPGGVRLDLADPHSVAAAAKGHDAAYLTTPLGPDEGEIGVAAVDALRQAGIGKIVYLAIHNLEAMREIPHFETKIPVKQAVLARPGNVVLQPNFFFQNDLMALPALMGPGIYPLPVGSVGVWSIDVADIARAAANVLTRPDWDGQAVPLCGPERLTGTGMAAVWSDALGRPVRYAGNPIKPFIEAMRARMPGMSDWIANDFEAMMRVTQRDGCRATPGDLSATEAIVGRSPIRYKDFVRRTIEEMPQ